MTCLLYWLTSFRGEDFKTFFPIGSYVKTTVCPLKVAILDGGQCHWTQFMSSMILRWSTSKIVFSDAVSGHSFNIGPYGKIV
jgi:hypothetical protein